MFPNRTEAGRRLADTLAAPAKARPMCVLSDYRASLI